MSTRSRPRAGSLQFWPRKRAAKVLPSANWRPIHSTNEGVLGFIAYKAGMASVMVKDLTEIVVSNDKELKRKVKLGKTLGNLEKAPKDYDDIRVIAFSLPKQTNIKKTPDMIELAIQSENKLEFVKKLIGKELSLSDFSKSDLLDVRGLTIGKGTQGPIKRFGATLRFHKSEKGLRKIGSIGPWHPARVTYQVPMAGQMGYFSRVVYNLNLVNSGKISDKDINPSSGFPHYGKIKTSYVLLRGSVPGPAKRQILLTPSYRPTKMQAKKKYEFLEVLQ